VIRFADGSERTILNEVFGVNSGGRVLAQRTQLPLDLGTVPYCVLWTLDLEAFKCSAGYSISYFRTLPSTSFYVAAVSLGYFSSQEPGNDRGQSDSEPQECFRIRSSIR
jgi:hypothetical protein